MAKYMSAWVWLGFVALDMTKQCTISKRRWARLRDQCRHKSGALPLSRSRKSQESISLHSMWVSKVMLLTWQDSFVTPISVQTAIIAWRNVMTWLHMPILTCHDSMELKITAPACLFNARPLHLKKRQRVAKTDDCSNSKIFTTRTYHLFRIEFLLGFCSHLSPLRASAKRSPVRAKIAMWTLEIENFLGFACARFRWRCVHVVSCADARYCTPSCATVCLDFCCTPKKYVLKVYGAF